MTDTPTAPATNPYLDAQAIAARTVPTAANIDAVARVVYPVYARANGVTNPIPWDNLTDAQKASTRDAVEAALTYLNTSSDMPTDPVNPVVYLVVTSNNRANDFKGRSGCLVTASGETLWGPDTARSIDALRLKLTDLQPDRRAELQTRYPDGWTVVTVGFGDHLPDDITGWEPPGA